MTIGLIRQRQHSGLVSVTVGILSAFVPTLIPQQWLALEPEDTDLEDTVGEEI